MELTLSELRKATSYEIRLDNLLNLEYTQSQKSYLVM